MSLFPQLIFAVFSYSLLSPLLLQDVSTHIHSRHAAVAIIMDAQKRILMIQRAEHPNDPWSGHMGFPGGGFETSDKTLQTTVQRECEEEIGLSLEKSAQKLGVLNRMNHPRICIDAFVYAIEEEPVLVPNEEVAGIFWIPLHELDSSKNRGSISHRFQGKQQDFPAIHLDDIPVPIWGISVGFIDQLLSRWRMP